MLMKRCIIDSMNILLIEDNIKMTENIKTVLCHEGYKITHHEMWILLLELIIK